MTKSKTVEQQLEGSKIVTTMISDANALVVRMKGELEIIRRTLEDLKDYQHPKLRMSIPYSIKGGRDEGDVSPARVIDQQITRINTILGDRA